MKTKPPFPPFTESSAITKVRLAENAWNSRDPEKVALAYTEDSSWRNRDQFLQGRKEIRAFLTTKWKKELNYRLVKDLWAFSYNRISVRFQYEYHDNTGQWFRAYGNEQWEFDDNGLMKKREASINELPILESDRLFRWDTLGPRPASHAGLESLEPLSRIHSG